MTAESTRAVACIAAVSALLLLVPMCTAVAQQAPGGTSAGSAGPVGHTGDLAALESAIRDYEKEMEGEGDLDRQRVLENVINRLDVAKAIIQSSQNLAGVQPQYQNLTTCELLALLHATYDPGDFVDSQDSTSSTRANPVAGASQMSALHTVIHATQPAASHTASSIDARRANNHYQHQYDCRDLAFVSGLAQSVPTSYTNGRAQITGTFAYPVDMDKRITERRNSSCLNFEHAETVKRHHVLASASPGGGHVKAQVFTLTAANPADSESVCCNAFGPNMLTLVTTSNTYESSSHPRTTELGSIASTLLLP